MISHKHRCVFIHIPKNGGTSIESALCRWNLTPSNYVELMGSKYHSKHHTLRSIKKDLRDKYFTFAFVRNPWDRAVSLYSYYRGGGNKKSDLRIVDKIPADFKTFVMSTWNIIPQSHRKEQFTYIKADDKINVDYICKFENMNEDWEYIAHKLKINEKLPHIRASKHLHYSTYYDDETREVISKRYANDIKRFKYKFKN